jgi:hypothetical protein
MQVDPILRALQEAKYPVNGGTSSPEQTCNKTVFDAADTYLPG